jgi:hypothetical protein
MYSSLRLTDQSAAGLMAIVRRLLVLSASLISLALWLFLSGVLDLLALSFLLRKCLVVTHLQNNIGNVAGQIRWQALLT